LKKFWQWRFIFCRQSSFIVLKKWPLLLENMSSSMTGECDDPHPIHFKVEIPSGIAMALRSAMGTAQRACTYLYLRMHSRLETTSN
jgi:hypothetical protein